MNEEQYNNDDRTHSLRGLTDRVDNVERQVQSLQTNVQSMQSKVNSIEDAVAANLQLIQGVKSDTEEIVTITKGLKIFGKVSAWAGGIAVAWLTFKGGVPW